VRRSLLTLAGPLPSGPVIGAPYYGGYYAGLVDTTAGNIIAGDFYQSGARYELIICPKSIEGAVNAYLYKTATTASPAESHTRWNGLAATAALVAATGHPAADYAANLTYPADGCSAWYLPSFDEAEILYRAFKPSAIANGTAAVTGTFPAASNPPGYNPSASPPNPAQSTGNPGQTSVPAFRSPGGSEAFPYTTSSNLVTVTENTATQFWALSVGTSGVGVPSKATKNSTIGNPFVRAVRRRLLT
jgi:hypothetical protein